MIDKDRSKAMVVLSLGAGVQSSTMAIMAAKGDLPPVDHAVFSDTQNEPKKVMLYLDLLKKILPYPVHIVSKGNIMEDMLAAKGKHFPKDKYVEQWIGISTDEAGRMKPARDKYILNRHPLIEAKMSRQDCIDYLKKEKIPLPEKSACIVCPYHNDAYWHFMKTERPSEFADAVDFDKQVRNISRKEDEQLYSHRSCKPLDEVEFNKKETDKQLDMFNNECEGMCGV